ncbi:MAG: dihydrodipicolinate synthase family protein [Solirubrobacterales bacterium]
MGGLVVGGILPVIPTPFRDGVFDEVSFGRLLDHMLPFVDGYTLLGSTGESPSLPDETRRQIAAAALRMTADDKRVVVGVSHTSAQAAGELARHAQDNGAHAVLCCAPYYFPNERDGILSHLAAVDAALAVDLVLYDNPVTTKTDLKADWVLDWAARLEHLRSVKLTDHDLGKIAPWREAGLSVLAGDDVILFQYLAEGVDGVMVIAPAVLPASFVAVWERVHAGDLNAALDIYSVEIAPFVASFGVGAEIATTKALLADLGVFESAELLAPLRPVGSDRTAQLRQTWELGVRAAEARAGEGAAA